jgi:DNA polymerase-3 subunit delta'
MTADPRTSLDGVRGQDAAITVIRRSLATDRLASAYLFHGPSGVGKERTALALAIERVSRGDEGLGRRILGGHHPDVRVFRPRDEGTRNLEVDVVRNEILPFTQFAPFEADSAFVIFPEADVSFPEQYPASANVLLKTLEEPRPNLHFILLAERPNRLLATIRSRCQPLRFRPLSNDLLNAILEENGIPEASRGPATALARGRADRAIQLAQSGTIEAIFDRAIGVHQLTMQPKPGELISASERLSKLDDDAQELELEALALLYRDMALTSTGVPTHALAFAQYADRIAAEASRLAARASARREGFVRTAVDVLDRNANVQVVLDALMFDLGRAR